EATWIILPHDGGVISSSATEVLEQTFASAQALLVGPGLGQDRQTEQFIRKLITGHEHIEAIGFVVSGQAHERIELPPLVLDADALKLLTKIKDWYSLIPANTILTPHPGEMSILTGLSVEAIQKERVQTAQEWSRKWGHVVVLKGAYTVIASPDGRTMVIPVATPALARAGTGDVLAGVIAGLRGQGLDPFEAAALGAYLHGRAGELVVELFLSAASVMAGDIADTLPEVFAELETS
ncbi:MAG: NAD(P)H-hydrate dehydratase, partial [Anaerolineales bacterium]